MLFSPIRINGQEIKNRIVMLPMATRFDLTTARARAYYTARARGGAGLIIVEGTSVDLFRGTGYAAAIQPLVQDIHSAGARVVLQLAKSPQSMVGSAIAPSRTEIAREATVEDIRWSIKGYAEAARLACEIGFDGVEIHGAHGFFTSQFFSPRANRRDDEYGGSCDSRMRFALESVSATRQAIGNDRILAYRMSAVEYVENGVTLENSQALACELRKAGVNLVDVSVGAGPLSTVHTSPLASAPMGTFAPLAEAIRSVVGIPVVAVGRINTRAVAEDCLSQGKADLVGVGRQLIADPMWPSKLEAGREEDVVQCLSCNEQCLGLLLAGLPISCNVNPDVGLEWRQREGSQ